VGKNVEQLLRNILRGSLPEGSFRINKVGKGGDIKVDVKVDVDLEFDLLDQNHLPIALEIVIEDKSFLIEVKSTQLDYVRITMPQAKEAVERKASFILCVVELPEGFEQLSASEAENVVRKGARFVLGIGPKVEKKFREAQEFRNRESQMKSSAEGDVAIDATAVQIRLRLEKRLWTEGDLSVLNFDQLLNLLQEARTPKDANRS